MRVCVAGGGLAGSVLTWRLASAAPDWRIDLLLGGAAGARADASAASGGAVRSYETHPRQRQLAAASMVELLASPTLRKWTGYRRTGSCYVHRGRPAGVDAAVADIDFMLPGSVQLIPAAELGGHGWAPEPDDGVAVIEHHAGYTSPDAFRTAVLDDGAVRRRVTFRPDALGSVRQRGDGVVECSVGGERRDYDLVVIAAGAWTPALLRAAGLPSADGYRTKSIQYGLYPVGDWCPPHFVDEVTGLYGRPATDGELLLGLPADLWDVDPDRPPTTPELNDRAARLATARFPKLRLGPATRQVGSVDCYADGPMLALRPVVDGVRTFSGGAGGCVKTVLAASRNAAAQLASAHG